ncbi:hypothetical protein C8J56DRAFT_854173 [Mycena floridula]|nr:hypothetical protein C8J56DRAFT_854173 [Mycena floridula]
MTRRKRFVPKKRKSKPKATGDPDAPTESEWETMESFKRFILKDKENERHAFNIGNDVLVLPPDFETGTTADYWVGMIRDIRARPQGDSQDVWIRIQWYYKNSDLMTLLPKFDTAACGQYERCFSDHYDFIHSTTLEAVVSVKRYVESDLSPPDIDFDEFYCRYDFETATRSLDPTPGRYSCLCNKPYSPEDNSIMHFCPRPGCCKAYHRACLIKDNHLEPISSVSDRPLRLLMSSPDNNDKFCAAGPPKKKAKGRKQALPSRSEATISLPDNLPKDLVLVAQQPIIKGALFRNAGVTGNVKRVIQARRMVYEALEGKAIPDDWDDDIDVQKAVITIRNFEDFATTCPSCQGPI